jgi:hypothetical protein
MPNLYQVLADAQHGQAIADLGREFGLTPQQTQEAVAALLPAISVGLKRSTSTPEGLANLFALMGSQPDLYRMYDDPRLAFSREGREAGNAALAKMFGSPDGSRAIADQAQQFSGIGSGILKKLLPVIAGLIISALMRSGSGQASPQEAPAPQPAPDQGGGVLADILRQIFKQGTAESGPASSGPSPVPPIGDILGLPRDGGAPNTSQKTPVPVPTPVPESVPVPTDGDGQTVPGGDLLGHILRELEKGLRDGRIKPVIVGPYKIDIPGQGGGSAPGGQQTPGADIFGQILRDLLGGAGGKAQAPGVAVFGDLLEPGEDIAPDKLDSFQEVLNQYLGAQRR